MDLKQFKVNYHFTEQCNMKCKFCFSKFDQKSVVYPDKKIIDKICETFGAINFAGGEPTLIKDNLIELAHYCKSKGLLTSVITNGSLMIKDKAFAEKLIDSMDIIGISIDSADININKNIGRSLWKTAFTMEQYKEVIRLVQSKNKVIKINTVVSQLNKEDISMKRFIEDVKPNKWKILRCMNVENLATQYTVSDAEYDKFFTANHVEGVEIVRENEMSNSYILLNPEGQLVNNRNGVYQWSDNLAMMNIEQINNFLEESFELSKYNSRYKEKIEAKKKKIFIEYEQQPKLIN